MCRGSPLVHVRVHYWSSQNNFPESVLSLHGGLCRDGTQIIWFVQQMPLPAEPFLRSLTQLPVFDFLNIKHLRIYVKNSAKTMWVIPRTTHKSKSSKYTLKSKYEFVSKEITSFWLLDFICKCALQTKGTELKEYILWYSRGSWSPHRTGKTAPPSFGGL